MSAFGTDVSREMRHVWEVPGSHAIYVSNPKAVADLLEEAASSIKQSW
jgi:hypothetical protein